MWFYIAGVALFIACILFGWKICRNSENQFDPKEESVFQKTLGLCDEYETKK